MDLDNNQYAAITQPGTATLTSANTSTSWTIEDVVAHADMIALDRGLQNSYASHLLEGKPLPINYTTVVSQSHAMSQTPSYSVYMVRSFTRLKIIFVNIYAFAHSLSFSHQYLELQGLAATLSAIS